MNWFTLSHKLCPLEFELTRVTCIVYYLPKMNTVVFTNCDSIKFLDNPDLLEHILTFSIYTLYKLMI